MKKVNIFAAAVTVLMLIVGTSFAKAQGSGKLTVRVGELRSDNGNVMIAIMNKDVTAFDWSKINPMGMDWKGIISFASMKKSSTEGTEFVVENLPEGEKLSVYIFHDENGNFIMDLNESMLPKEGFVKSDRQGENVPSVVMDSGDRTLDVKMTYLHQ